MKGFVIYSTKTGEKIAEDLSFGSENLFSVAAKEIYEGKVKISRD